MSGFKHLHPLTTRLPRSSSGFSLIELLFSMLFLSVIVFGVIKLQTSNLTLSNTKQLELKAHSYAGQALEIVSALGLTQVTTVCGADDCYFKAIPGGYGLTKTPIEELDGGLFTRTITQTEPPELINASLVTATVKWTDSAGEHEVSAKRVIFK